MPGITTQSSDPPRTSVGRPLFGARAGLVMLMVFFVVQPFHYLVTYRLPFYREIFMLGITLLTVLYLLQQGLSPLWEREVGLISVWIAYIAVSWIYDPQVLLYGEDIYRSSTQLSGVEPKDYVIRNLLLYVPLSVFLRLRGLTIGETQILAFLSAAVAPLSAVVFYQEQEIYGYEEAIGHMRIRGGLAYNTYSPYMTFPFVVGLYLYAVSKTAWTKVAGGAAVTFAFAYVALSKSRQSVFYCLICYGLFLLARGSKRSGRSLVTVVATLLLAVPAILILLEHSDFLLPRYVENLFETQRTRYFVEGLAHLDGVSDWVLGKGLSAVVFSGPHNNYVRFIQRIGLVGMVLTYLPFIPGLFRSLSFAIKNSRRPTEQSHALLITMVLFFTLFHSIFGYPHEDAFNAPYVWFGIGLWLANKRHLAQLTGTQEIRPT